MLIHQGCKTRHWSREQTRHCNPAEKIPTMYGLHDWSIIGQLSLMFIAVLFIHILMQKMFFLLWKVDCGFTYPAMHSFVFVADFDSCCIIRVVNSFDGKAKIYIHVSWSPLPQPNGWCHWYSGQVSPPLGHWPACQPLQIPTKAHLTCALQYSMCGLSSHVGSQDLPHWKEHGEATTSSSQQM